MYYVVLRGRINIKKDLGRLYGHKTYSRIWDMYQLPFSSDLVTKSRDRVIFLFLINYRGRGENKKIYNLKIP